MRSKVFFIKVATSTKFKNSKEFLIFVLARYLFKRKRGFNNNGY